MLLSFVDSAFMRVITHIGFVVDRSKPSNGVVNETGLEKQLTLVTRQENSVVVPAVGTDKLLMLVTQSEASVIVLKIRIYKCQVPLTIHRALRNYFFFQKNIPRTGRLNTHNFKLICILYSCTIKITHLGKDNFRIFFLMSAKERIIQRKYFRLFEN